LHRTRDWWGSESRIDLATVNQLKEQKRLEDGWAANNKEPKPKYVSIALDLASAAKAF